MPAVAPKTLTFTPEGYFEWEATQLERHEYHFGEVYPMPGGSSAHAELIAHLTFAFMLALRDSDCTVRSEAMRVEIDEDHYVYPDLSVTCGPSEFRSSTQTTLLNPTLVVEVLSPSTRSYDVGEKFELYRTLEPLREVLFVDSERRRVEVARRTADGWTLGGPVSEGEVRLASAGVVLDLDEVYGRVL